MNRRSLLALLTGGAASAPFLPKPPVLLSRAAAIDALNDGPSGAVETVAHEVLGGNSRAGSHAVVSRLWRLQDRAEHAPKNMPTHIAGKRSWSQAFKETVYQREIDLMRDIIEKAERDEEFAARLGKLMGLTE